MNDVCSVELLTNAVANRLSADEEAALYDHLERCEACCARMEQLAGGEQWQQEAALLLTTDELDAAVPEPMVWSEVDFSVENLEPSEDANVLGQLGGYDVLAIVGRGGMGVVLKAFDRELKRLVAIKVLAPHLAHSSVARKRFAREAQAAAAVVNPHVIAIHHVQPTGRLPFLIMPLLTGESLAQRLKARGPLELTEVLRIGMQAAAGLAAAHDQGLVHRDVKPANIFLEKGVERVVITDFGLARAADDVSMTRQGVVAGTPEYMSPEQARGETLDGRSDLFSLGCVLYEMATGVSPFRTDSTMATLRRIVDEQPAAMASLVPELPPWFCHIVKRLLSKDPAQRFAAASEVSELLEQCLSHLQQPTKNELPTFLCMRQRGLKRKYLASAITLAIAIFLGGGITAWLTRPHQAAPTNSSQVSDKESVKSGFPVDPVDEVTGERVKPTLPAGVLCYVGKVQEWVGGDRNRLWEVDDVVYKPVPNATLRLYRVSPITKGGAGYQFEEIGVFNSDAQGRFKINIPDNLKRFIPTPGTKEWDDWESLLLVTTSAPGFATDSTTLAVNRGLDSIELIRGTSIRGRLVDENEKPIVGAHVTVNAQSRSTSREEMDEWLGQTSKTLFPVANIDPSDTDAIFAARTPATIAKNSMQWIPTQIEGVITDQDGRFVIDGIGPDDAIHLVVECFGYNNASIKVIGREIETVYSRDPFGSGENIAVHGRTLQATLIASDRGSPHSRHRVIKAERTKDQVEANASDPSAKEESDAPIEKPPAVEKGLSPVVLFPDPTSGEEEAVSGVPTKLDAQSSIEAREQISHLVESGDAKPELPPMIERTNDNESVMPLKAVYEIVRPTVVSIDWGDRASDNGTIISPEGHVLVHENVVHRVIDRALFVTLQSGKRLNAKRLGWSSQWGIGLLKIESNEAFPFAQMVSGISQYETDHLAVGFPYRPYRIPEEPDVRWGTVAERFGSKCFRATNRLRVSHGTGVFDSRGYLVGICTHTSSSGYYCTSSGQVASLWDELTSRKNVDEKRLFDQNFDLSIFGRSTNINGTGETNQNSETHAATVRLREKSREFGWSGVVVTADGIVVTCAHHACPVGTELVAELPDGRDFPAKVVGMNPVTDIGLVQILIEKGQTLPCAKIGRSTTLEGKEAATALSFPADHRSRTPLKERGQIAAHGSPGFSFVANDEKTKWICAVFAEEGRVGQSGSGLFNANGELVGIFIIGGRPRHFVRIEAVLDQWKWLTSDDVFRPNPKPSSAVRAKFRATTANVRPSVVEVLCDDKRSSIGVVVGADGRILTKLSELHGNLSCRLSDGAKYAATIIKSSKDNDLALIKIEPKAPLTALPLDTSILERFAHIAAVLPTGKRPWKRGMPPKDDSPVIGIVTEAPQRIAPIAGLLGLFSDDPNGVRLTGRVVRTVGLELNDVVQSINGKQSPNLKAFEKVMHPIPESVIGYAGDKVSVKFVRGEETLEKECVLAENTRESLDEESPRRSGFTRAYDSDLEIYQAECGAPVVDVDGNWIGIAIATRGTGYVYVLSSSAIHAFLAPSK